MLAVSEVPLYAEGVTTKTSLRPDQSSCDAKVPSHVPIAAAATKTPCFFPASDVILDRCVLNKRIQLNPLKSENEEIAQCESWLS